MNDDNARQLFEMQTGRDWDVLGPDSQSFWRSQAERQRPEALLTLEEAAQVLHPPVDKAQLKALVEVAGLQPAGVRRRLGPGRPAHTYPMRELMRIHAAVVPLMNEFAASAVPSGV